METKILFLDIDGPIATDHCFNAKRFLLPNTGFEEVEMPYIWNKDCVYQLNTIINKTDCDIVLSSDWRKHYSLYQMRCMFDYYGVDPFKLKGFTDNIPLYHDYEGSRTKEINKWVEQHKILKWCAVDDMVLNVKNFVHIQDTSQGITEDIANKIIKYLK